MSNNNKTKEELTYEIKLLQNRIAELEARNTENEHAERELKESKALLDAVVENVPLMIFLKEATDLRFVIFNRAGEELLGYDRKDLLGKNNLDLFPAEQAENFMAKDREALREKGGVVDIPEEPILTAKKGQRLLHTRKVCIRGTDGITKFLLGISEDITERKKVEDEIARLLAIIEESPDFIGTADLQGNLLYHNRAAKRMVGLPEDANLSGMKIRDMHPIWAAKLVEEEGIPTIIRCGLWKSENILRHRDGSEIPVSQVLVLHRDSSGKPKFISTIMRDITDRKKTEDALTDSNNFLQQIIRSANDGIVVYDLNLKIQTWNPFMEKMTGKKSSEVMGKHPLELFPFLKEAGLIEKLNRVLSEGISEMSEFRYHIPESNKEGWAADISSPLRNAQNETIGIIGIIRDITDRIKMQDDLTKELDRIKHFNKLMVDRELRVLELKKEIADLKERLPDS